MWSSKKEEFKSHSGTLPEELSWLWPEGGIAVSVQLDPVGRSGERLTP